MRAWRRRLPPASGARPPTLVVTVARGSSDYAATYDKYLIEPALALVVASAALSLASVYGVRAGLAGALHISISQSGRSPDLLAGVTAAKAAGALTVTLLNDTTAPLAALADVVVPLHAGPELAVATKSYLAAFAAILQLTAASSGDAALATAAAALPERLAAARATEWDAAAPVLARAAHLSVIARGVGLWAAQELALKFKETWALHPEAFSAAEVMHGPATLVGTAMPVLALVQDDAGRAGTRAAAALLAERGGTVWRAASGQGALPLPSAHPAVQPLLLLQTGYALAGAVARARGTDLERPPHRHKVTSTI